MGPDKGCPAYRQSVEERDIQTVYLGASSQTPDIPEGYGDIKDIISLASNSIRECSRKVVVRNKRKKSLTLERLEPIACQLKDLCPMSRVAFV